VGKKKPDDSAGEQPTFEEALQQLEEIVHQLEEGEIGLNEALARYEQGVKLLRQCYDLLERAERKIELLGGVDSQGNPATEPFDDEALSLDEKAQRRSRRRTAATPKPRETEPGDSGLDVSGGLF